MTQLLCYSTHMLRVTENNLIIAQQPQNLFTAYKVPVPVVIDMINEASKELRQQNKQFLGAASYQAVAKDIFSSGNSFFAARRYRYKKHVYVIRIQYHFVADKKTKQTVSVVVSHAEVMNEKEYQPVLPL
jgi:hypothetical protein